MSSASAGPLPLLLILLLGVATVFLIRNMSSRIKRLPPSFDEPPVTPAEEDGDGTASGPTAGA